MLNSLSPRQKKITLGVGICAALIIIIGVSVGVTQSNNGLKSTSGQVASLQLCTGQSCAVAGACRSQYGFCGIGAAWCNDQSTWKPDGCTASVPLGGVNCTGDPCKDLSMCVSGKIAF